MRFGIRGSGIKFEAKHYWANWTDPPSEVENWVCAYQPIIHTVIFDCIPEVLHCTDLQMFAVLWSAPEPGGGLVENSPHGPSLPVRDGGRGQGAPGAGM